MPSFAGRVHRKVGANGCLALALALALGLAAATLACGDGPELVSRHRLLAPGSSGDPAPLALSERTVGDETRPAVRIDAAAPATWIAPAAGFLHFGVAPGESSTVHTVLRLVAPGGREAEIVLGRVPRWRALGAGIRVARGSEVSFSLAGGGDAWISDPRVESPRPEPAPPLVVVILIDTLRADHVSLAGYPIPTTPALEALADDGVAFLRAYVPAPWTRPSAASLLTGLGPDRHLVQRRSDRLREDVETWAEIARDQGYRTLALVTNPNVLAEWGFGQGFARFVDLGSESWEERKTEAREVYERALVLLDEERPPIFLFLHVLDPHHPYVPPVEVARRLYPDFRDVEPGAEMPEQASEEMARAAVRRYDGEIHDADLALGRFLDGLRARGLYEDAVLVVAGDHGEEFLDHGGRYHGHTLYEEQLRVPLVLKLPGERPARRRDESLVSILDALPTVAEALGWPVPAGLEGRSLLPRIRGAGPVRERLLAQTRLDDVHAFALVTPDRKLIRQLAPAPRTLLFDLARDPGERMPRYAPEELAALGRELDRLMVRAQGGWHVRACAGSEPAELAFAVEGLRGEPRLVGLEPGDVGTTSAGRLDARLSVARRREFGASEERPPVPDEDEIVFAGERIVLRPETAGAAPLIVAGEPRAWTGPATLEPAHARHPSADPPVCPDGGPASVLAWYVEEPDAAHHAPDAALRRRLGALGYLDDPEPGDAPF